MDSDVLGRDCVDRRPGGLGSRNERGRGGVAHSAAASPESRPLERHA